MKNLLSPFVRLLWHWTVVDLPIAIGILVGLMLFCIAAAAWASSMLWEQPPEFLRAYAEHTLVAVQCALAVIVFIFILVAVSALLFGKPNQFDDTSAATPPAIPSAPPNVLQVETVSTATVSQPWSPRIVTGDEHAHIANNGGGKK